MRYLILSDIHANLEALETCLAHAAGRGYDETLVLGDLVGYGADPGAVVERVIALDPTAIVRGNHDKVAAGLDPAEGFNAAAKRAALWTMNALSAEHRVWLAALPIGPLTIGPLIEICHGSPFDEDAYVFDEADALHALQVSARPLCLFGHTHYPVVFDLTDDVLDTARSARGEEVRLSLQEGAKYLVNPGSIGQPRDGDPRAAYAIVDVDERHLEMFRIEYDLETTQRKIIDAVYPSRWLGGLPWDAELRRCSSAA